MPHSIVVTTKRIYEPMVISRDIQTIDGVQNIREAATFERSLEGDDDFPGNNKIESFNGRNHPLCKYIAYILKNKLLESKKWVSFMKKCIDQII